jgi:hypothetical protein
MEGTNLNGAQLQGANLEYAELQNARLVHAELQGANLNYAKLRAADLHIARLQGADLKNAQLQAADLRYAWLQGADLHGAQLQGAQLSGAQLQGAQLSGAQLQGADLSKADLTNSDLDGAFVFRANMAFADLATSAIRSIHADQVEPAKDSDWLERLNDPDVEAWIAAATQFAAKEDKEGISNRFDRLKLNPGFQTPEQDAADEAKWNEKTKQLLASDPNGVRHRQGLAAFLAKLACGADGAPYVALGLIQNGRLAPLGDQLDSARRRLEAGREKPDACKGVAGLTEEDWRALDAIKPAEAAPADH